MPMLLFPSATFFFAAPSEMLRMRLANLNVQRVSSLLPSAGDALKMNMHLADPPSADCSRNVSLEFLNGMWPCPLSSASITSPSALRLLLIPCASFIACPVTPLFATRSLPAKSTKYKRPVTAAPPLVRVVTSTINTMCDLEEVAFIAVADTERVELPSSNASSTPGVSSTAVATSPGTVIRPSFPCLISSLVFGSVLALLEGAGVNKQRTSSL
mmetsp:Transcript_70792/g.121565  ORF Transcript_70792/g.121565 Transcript_70792/m.121565 type:complete len:214 (+) Transcript_70792:1087-1728(+)